MSSFPPALTPSFNPPFSQFTNSRTGLRHVTIRQVLKASHIETHFEIDDQPVGFVVLLANVYDVSLKGGRLIYGLDDGTGRMNAFSWITDEDYANRTVAEYQQEQFVYARAIGKISEYRDIYSVQLEKINRVVKSYEEICHHLLSCMVETRMCKDGPPSRAVIQAASDAAKINYPPPEPTTTKPWRDDSSGMASTNASHAPTSPLPPRTPSPVLSQRIPVTEPRSQRPRTPMTPPSTSIPQPHTAPQRKIHPIENLFTGPSRKTPPPSSPLHLQQRRPSQLFARMKFSSGPSAAPVVAVDRYQAFPEFVSITPPLLFPSEPPKTEPYKDGEDTRTSSLTRARSPMSETVAQMRMPRRTIRRDPYSHLSSLQRDIILTLQNAMSTSGGKEGMGIAVLVQMIVSRRPDISDTELSEAIDVLLEREYIYNTIDESHFACKI